MRKPDGKKLIIALCAALLFAVVIFSGWKVMQTVNALGKETDFTVESLRWTIIGAMGSWMGSIFGAVALVVSLFALWLPQRVKIEVSVSTGFMLSQIPGLDRIDSYVITVRNVGMKPITVSNVYLHFGNRNNGDIFVGMLNVDSVLQAFTPRFPIRLDQGESFDYYLLRDKLDKALAHYQEKTSPNSPLSIRVDEVTRGTRYYRTKWSLRTFLGE